MAFGAGQHLVEVHDHFRRELTQLRDVIDQVRRGTVEVGDARSAINAMALRANLWTVGSICLSFCHGVTSHHTLETEAVFPHLRGRDDALGAVIDRLNSEHVEIHELLEAIDAELILLVSDDERGYTALDKAVDAMAEMLLEHLSYEESQLVGPLNAYGFY